MGTPLSVSSIPNPENPKEKFGKTKPCPQYIPPIAILEESIVMALGAEKYTAFNWNTTPVRAGTYYSAALRHVMQWFCGEDTDPESGALHLAHARACLGILIDASATGNLIDDRPKTASASEAITRLTKTEISPLRVEGIPSEYYSVSSTVETGNGQMTFPFTSKG